ncbi:MAG: alkaline phosphatase family protein [Nanoarchaeota archaeon]|nr:alkaline phosphatase family protein [Nanoarchaeota archaeon]
MYLPNYKNGSIVNLMSSISRAFGTRAKYKPLKILNTSELKSKNIVLLVIDGLGYEYLMNYKKDNILKQNLKGRMTSVFPATTGAAIPTFLTGVPVQQHAITGWFVYLKEIGLVSTILPFIARIGSQPLSKIGVKPKKIFTEKSYFDRIKAISYVIRDKTIAYSDFALANKGKARVLSFKPSSLNGLFMQIKKAINSSNRRKYIYAYWPDFDTLCHNYGTKSIKTSRHFMAINKKLQLFLKSIKGTDTTIIITSDHGFIDSDKSRLIELKKHPKLSDAMIIPLCGERRLAYCYVCPSKTKQFEDYVRKNLKHACYLCKSRDLIKKNYFGLFKPNKKLYDRVGDYTLIMKENYVIMDSLLGEKRGFHIGNHGGVSKQEMHVPLIIITK